ncbi:DUF4214 domain-containing protein [Pseudochelatococcus contaminans]|uniref:DUF4214 domain-containing protein n=1 Tax=Pseudochelatococcus contaminans TaxID=1538103 RepID=A0A7W5Z2V1_9HYPH|nr:DUF4214 domain-containing protein [Pseudochelatococcus contaminans]MBB3809093.1 hypothetical protein [Pseudochelatococcus contaminans]
MNRAPEPEGLNYWIGRLTDPVNPLTISQIANNFATQPETTALYPYLRYPNLFDGDTEAFVTEIYQNLFARAPEAEGLAYWTAQLESGAVAIGDFILTVIQSARNFDGGQDLTTLNNKTAVGISYAEQVAKANAEWTPESARAAIKDVDATAASVTAAEANITAFVATGSWPGATGESFTLTTGIDAIVGTAADDTIQGVVSGTASASTLNPLDSINGGAGVNTLNLVAQDAPAGKAIQLPGAATVTIENIQTVNIISSTGDDVVTTSATALEAAYFGGQVQEIWQIGADKASTVVLAKNDQVAGFSGTTDVALNVTAAKGVESVGVALKDVADKSKITFDGAKDSDSLTTVTISGKAGAELFIDTDAQKANIEVDTINLGLTSKTTVDFTVEEGVVEVVDASTSTGALTFDFTAAEFTNLQEVKGGSGNDTIEASIAVLKDSTGLVINGGAGVDTLQLIITAAPNNATKVSLIGGEGKDTFELASGAKGNLFGAITNDQNLIDNLVSVEDFAAADDVLSIKDIGAGLGNRVANNTVEQAITKAGATTLFETVTAVATTTVGNAKDFAVFNFEGSAYIYVDLDGAATLKDDALIKVTGVSNSALTDANFIIA